MSKKPSRAKVRTPERKQPVRAARKADRAARKPTVRATHKDIIKLWPSVIEFARDIGVSVPAARKMVLRDNISDEHWAAIERAASRRGVKTARGESITVSLLAEIRGAARAARGRRVPNPTKPPETQAA